MIIYKIGDKTNGKIYIGQTIRTLKERMCDHAKQGKAPIDQEFKKKGKECFTAEIIDTASNVDELDLKERKWIAYYKSNDERFGYNKTNGGWNDGRTVAEEVKAKISKTMSAKYQGENNPFFGKHHSLKQREKWSRDRKGKFPTKAREMARKAVSKKVRNLDTGEVFESISAAGKAYNIDSSPISAACRGKTKTSCGCRWEYVK